MKSIESMFNASGSFSEKIDNLIGYADGEYNSLINLIGADGGWDNAIGTCGMRPVGIGKKHKERLAAWDECRKKLQDLKLQEKEGKVSAKDAEAQANVALANAVAGGVDTTGSSSNVGPDGTPLPDPNNPQATGMSMAAMIGIAVGGAIVVGLGIFALVKMGKGKAAA